MSSKKATTVTPPRDQSTRRVLASGKPRPIPLTEKSLLDYEDVASLTGLSVWTVRQMVHDGLLRVTIVRKHHRFTPEDLATCIAEQRANSGARA